GALQTPSRRCQGERGLSQTAEFWKCGNIANASSVPRAASWDDARSETSRYAQVLLLYEDNQVLPRQNIEGFFPFQRMNGHFLAELGNSHFVQRFDRNFRVFSAIFDKDNSATR